MSSGGGFHFVQKQLSNSNPNMGNKMRITLFVIACMDYGGIELLRIIQIHDYTVQYRKGKH